MPDLDLIKQAEQEVRDRRGRFARGRSGNPAGRPRGCRDDVNRDTRVLLAYSWLPLSRGREFGRPRDLLTASFAGVTNDNRSIVIHAI